MSIQFTCAYCYEFFDSSRSYAADSNTFCCRECEEKYEENEKERYNTGGGYSGGGGGGGSYTSSKPKPIYIKPRSIKTIYTLMFTGFFFLMFAITVKNFATVFEADTVVGILCVFGLPLFFTPFLDILDRFVDIFDRSISKKDLLCVSIYAGMIILMIKLW